MAFCPHELTEKQDGLQIVFLRHNKKHSGVYKCVKVKVRLLFPNSLIAV